MDVLNLTGKRAQVMTLHCGSADVVVTNCFNFGSSSAGSTSPLRCHLRISLPPRPIVNNAIEPPRQSRTETLQYRNALSCPSLCRPCVQIATLRLPQSVGRCYLRLLLQLNLRETDILAGVQQQLDVLHLQVAFKSRSIFGACSVDNSMILK